MAEFGLAFLAGLLSFLSPCVLPLVPVYLAFLTGTSYDHLLSHQAPRRTVLSHALSFTLGFSLVFIALGASASALGGLLFERRETIERVGGGVLALLGLWMLGVLRFDLLHKDARFHLRHKPAGFAGSVLVGAAFASGWTPCVGPVLAGILLIASRSQTVGRGVLLLAVYSLGFALPLLACALAFERSARLLKRFSRFLPLVEKGTGVLLLFLGAALASGWFGRVSTWILSRFPGWAGLLGRLGL